MMTTKNILFSIGCLVAILYSWEYTAIRRGYEVSPSVWLNFVSTKAQHFWETCGIWAAWLSSFLTVFDFKDMAKAAKQLVTPAWATMTSWIYFPIGYVSEMNLYDYPYVIILGSITALSLICYLMYYFDQWKRFTPLVERFGSWCAPISTGSASPDGLNGNWCGTNGTISTYDSSTSVSQSVSEEPQRVTRRTPARRRGGY